MMSERVIETIQFSSAYDLKLCLGRLTGPMDCEVDVAVEQHDSRTVRAFEIVERDDRGVKSLSIRFVPWVDPHGRRQDGHMTWCAAVQWSAGSCNCGCVSLHDEEN